MRKAIDELWRVFADSRERHIDRPLRAALYTGFATGIVSALTSVVVLTILHFLLPPWLWGPSAATSLGSLSVTALFVMAVIVGPVFETVLGQVLPIEIVRGLGATAVICITLSALAFAVGHYVNGGVAHGTAAFFSGGWFACAYVCMRSRGLWTAFATASTAHATHNAVLLSIIAPLFPQWA
jgi:hypothetical protein